MHHRLGQHFLKNTSIAEKMAAALDILPGETIIEIGPGHGELTMPLLDASAPTGATVIAIERDRALVPALAERAERSSGRLMVVEADVLKALPQIVHGINDNENGSHHPSYIVTGNIPYYITGKLLRILSELAHKPRITAFMVQKEVAERICAVPPNMNRLAASVQFWAKPKIIASVPKGDFSPPPEVDSSVIVLTTMAKTPNVAPELYYKVIRGVFAQPRKTILNNVAAAAGTKKELVEDALGRMGIDPAARPQNLGIGQLVTLASLDLWG